MTRRRLALLLVGIGAAVAVVLATLSPGREGLDTLPMPRAPEPLPAATPADFVGSERCASCHAAEYALWRRSTHGRAGGARPDVIAAPFGGPPIRFANAEVVPRVRSNRREFVVQRPLEPAVVLRVEGAIGGGHIYGGGTQGFVSRWPDGTWRFLPFEYSRHARVWFCNTNARSGRGWIPITETVRLEECGDWPPVRVLGDHPRYGNCQSCHASQAVVVTDTNGSSATRIASLDINCESCHGPGLRHVRLAESGQLAKSSDIGLVSLGSLDKDASIRVCYQCHALKDRLRDGFTSGDSLERFYSLKLPMLGDRPLFPDGRTRTFAYQEGHNFSDCYLNGGMTCASCHDPHSQGYRDVNGVALSGRFDDRQCTGCHLSKSDQPAVHTRHAAGSTSCISCHMPARQQPDTRAAQPGAGDEVVLYARFDHTISIPRPEADSALGLSSGCAGCHRGTTAAAEAAQIRRWWGALKPVPATVAAQLRYESGTPMAEAATLLLGRAGDTVSANAVSLFAGASRFLEDYVAADVELPGDAVERLAALARSTDIDVRAVALATLHLSSGRNRGTGRLMADVLRSEGTNEAGLRARWATVLGHMGDRYAASGVMRDALIAYARAVDVQPSNARLLLGLGNAQRSAGATGEAAESYRRSIAIDPRQPLGWVNLGIALGELRDVPGAAGAFERAIALDRWESLAWFNLANMAFEAGNLARADSLYAQAVTLDPSLVPAHFQLARSSILRGDRDAATRHLRRGLAFDSSDAEARRTLRNLMMVDRNRP